MEGGGGRGTRCAVCGRVRPYIDKIKIQRWKGAAHGMQDEAYNVHGWHTGASLDYGIGCVSEGTTTHYPNNNRVIAGLGQTSSIVVFQAW